MEDLTPMTQEEFAKSLRILIAALRARKKIRDTYRDEHVASNLAEALWRSGVRPFQKRPIGAATSAELRFQGFKG